MKVLAILIGLTLIVSQGCKNENADLTSQVNVFSSTADTLIIMTENRRGAGLFSLGVSPGYFRDLTDSFSHSISVPSDLMDVQRMELLTDYRATTKYYVDVIQGTMNGDTVFIQMATKTFFS